MKKLLAIGEALIDMIPSNTGRIMDVEGSQPKVGGAPLNVCGAYTCLLYTSKKLKLGYSDEITIRFIIHGAFVIERAIRSDPLPNKKNTGDYQFPCRCVQYDQS